MSGNALERADLHGKDLHQQDLHAGEKSEAVAINKT